MRRSLYLSACLVTTASLWAQGTFVSPPSFATAEGPGSAYVFGCYPDSRFQLLDGELNGMKLSLSEVSFRLDHRNHTSSTATGHTWTQVVLSVSDTDWTQATSTFTKNQYTTPVEVYNSKAAWATVQGTPFVQPTPFGGQYAFPFKSPYTYTGSRDLLMDFIFRGGMLDNKVTWASTSARYYYLDGDSSAVSYTSPRTYYPSTEPNPRCRDSAISSNVSAYTYVTLNVHGATHSNATYRDKAEFQLYSYYTAPNARIITAIAFGGVAAGVNIGARCNSLYALLQGPWLALGRTTTNSSGYSGTFTAFANWTNGMRNVPVWVQTAWDDSKFNQLSLTRAMHVVMPSAKPLPPRKMCLYHYNLTSANGFGPYINNAAYNPISRFTYK